MKNLIKQIKDLRKQATTEKSHYYVASILQRVLFALEIDRKLFKKQDKIIAKLKTKLNSRQRDKETKEWYESTYRA